MNVTRLPLYHSGTQEDSSSPSLGTADPGSDLTSDVTFQVTGMMLADLGWNWHGAQAPFAFALRAILVSIGPRATHVRFLKRHIRYGKIM